MKKLLLLFLITFCLPVFSITPHEKQYELIGSCGEDTDLSTAQGLVDFTEFTAAEVEQATRVFMFAEGGDVRWRPDGTNPTDSVGFILVDGGQYTFFLSSTPISDLRLKAADSTADVFACLFK